MTSMEKIGEKRNVYHLPEAAPPQNLRHVQSTLVRSEWLQNNIF